MFEGKLTFMKNVYDNKSCEVIDLHNYQICRKIYIKKVIFFLLFSCFSSRVFACVQEKERNRSVFMVTT